ncbi:MAG: transaldolase family protein [Hungatella sp.]
MKILIDTADINVIKKLYTIFHFDGVTTNPKLLARIDGDPMEILKEIRRAIPNEAELHVQVVSSEKEAMLQEAEYILEQIIKVRQAKMEMQQFVNYHHEV